MFEDTKLFLAEVTNVYPKRVVGKQALGTDTEIEVVHEAYTIDVKPAAHRMPLQGVRVLIPTAGTGSNVNSGFVWLPSVGDWVVCGFLEGYPDFAICFGVVRNPLFNKPSDEGEVFDDYVIHHQSDSWIRMRNLEKEQDPSSTQIRSEVKIHHKSGTELEFTEPEVDKCECSITHNTGTIFKIDQEGNIEITTEKDVKVIGKTVTLGDESKAQGVQTKQTIPFCRYTGEPFEGLPNIKAG